MLDRLWKEHLLSMDHLRQGIHLRGYAQKNPKQEYKRESHEFFQRLLGNIRGEVVSTLSALQIRSPEEVQAFEEQELAAREDEIEHAKISGPESDINSPEPISINHFNGQKVSRNDRCPCGSGQKFKRCHGSVAQTG